MVDTSTKISEEQQPIEGLSILLPVVNVASVRSTFVSARNANTTQHLNTHAAILIPVVAVRSTGVNHAIMREIPQHTCIINHS